MTPQEIINVVKAFEEGKEIEFQHKNSEFNWQTVTKPTWNFNSFNYRVKLIEKELLEKNPDTNFLRTTKLWWDEFESLRLVKKDD